MAHKDKRVRVTTRVDKETRDQANEVFERLGLNMSSGIATFLHQVVEEDNLPFKLGGRRGDEN